MLMHSPNHGTLRLHSDDDDDDDNTAGKSGSSRMRRKEGREGTYLFDNTTM